MKRFSVDSNGEAWIVMTTLLYSDINAGYLKQLYACPSGCDGLIGVCHDVSVDIDSVEVKQPIFVVEHCNNDLILG